MRKRKRERAKLSIELACASHCRNLVSKFWLYNLYQLEIEYFPSLLRYNLDKLWQEVEDQREINSDLAA